MTAIQALQLIDSILRQVRLLPNEWKSMEQAVTILHDLVTKDCQNTSDQKKKDE